jgi:eukaryotic-like serine/threonine-protein kinase
MDALIPGTQLGNRYRLLDELGRGGMARVWRAVDEVLGRVVAVKVLAPALAADRDFLDRFRVEARAAAQLAHPNIASVFDYGEWDTPSGERVACIVLELLEGESLASRLQRGPLPWPEAVAAAAQVARALAAAHRRGVVHRDVKPGNVLLTEDGAKVLDFGIAAMTGEPAQRPAGGVLGTHAYIAPELLAGGPSTPAADVYGLGVLLYESFTGRLPGAEAGAAEPVGALEAIGGLPAAVVELERRCLGAPAERPSSAGAAATLGEAAGIGSGPATARRTGSRRAGGDTALLLGSDIEDHLVTRTIARLRPAGWLAGAVVGAALVLALVLAVAWRPAIPRHEASPASTTVHSTAGAPASSVPPVVAQGSAAAAMDSLERVQRSIDQGVASGQMRPDVGQDLDNLVFNLRSAIGSGGDPTDLAQRVQALREKVEQRTTEPGAITPSGAGAVREALGELARSLPSP